MPATRKAAAASAPAKTLEVQLWNVADFFLTY
jgi:hypothetical protein